MKNKRKHTFMQALSKKMKAEKKAKTNLEDDGKEMSLESGGEHGPVEGAGVETSLGGGLGEGNGFETPPAGEAPTTPELATQTSELASETSKPEPWPEAGVKVAVGVEHLAHCLRVGEAGVSEGSAPDAADEVIVRFKSTFILAPLRIPRSLLVAEGKPMKNMRLWDKVSDSVKRDLLKQLGVREPRVEVLNRTTEMNVTMWSEYLPIGLKLEGQNQYHFVQPSFVSALLAGDEVMKKAEEGKSSLSFAALEEEGVRSDGRLQLLQRWWRQHEVLLVCACDEASSSAALLAMRKNPFSMRFYEVGAGGRV